MRGKAVTFLVYLYMLINLKTFLTVNSDSGDSELGDEPEAPPNQTNGHFILST